jgi:hypothetical protein
MDAYHGGWQVLLPNGGDECVVDGVTWGYHGEAAMAPWVLVSAEGNEAVLETRLHSVAIHLRRHFALRGPVLSLSETVTNEGPAGVEFMWSHHPAFGAPFLDGSCTLSVGCRRVLADDREPGTLLAPGSRHAWPLVTDVDGTEVDLSRVPAPDQPRAVLAYLEDFEEGYFAITNPGLELGVGIRWPLAAFDRAWLWQEVHAGQGWPWHGRAYALAVEPASTVPGQGWARARAAGQAGTRLATGESREITLEAVVFQPRGAVVGIDEGGTVRYR